MPNFVPKILYKKQSADILNAALMEGDRIVKMALCIGIFANDQDESESKVSETLTYFREIGWTMKEDAYIHFPLLVNSIPLSADRGAVGFLKRYHTLASSHAVEFMPVIGDWAGTGTPMLNFVDASGNSKLKATWSILKQNKPVSIKEFHTKTPSGSNDYDAKVAAQSRALGLFAQEIAEGFQDAAQEIKLQLR